MIRVLHSVSNMDRAGIETMLMNYYRHIDRTKIQFDFLCNKKKPGAYDEEIISMGGRIFHTPGLIPTKYPQYLEYMKDLFDKYPEYRIIEAHNGALGVYALHAAKKNNIPVRIFHAHGASITKDWKWPIKMFCKSRIRSNINIKFTCGIAAAQCYYGKKVVQQSDYELIPNAIEVERFLYDSNVRMSLRHKYQLEKKHVVGHVGRFMAQKNHKFLISVFAEIAARDELATLVLLGDGELMMEIQKKVAQLNLIDRVIFVGNVENANEWYSAFDVFVLPSTWEGLPVVGVEAQAADLPCFFSSNITREIELSDKAYFLSLEAPISEWAKCIIDKFDDTRRESRTTLITEAHYNIKVESKYLEKRYMELYGEQTQ